MRLLPLLPYLVTTLLLALIVWRGMRRVRVRPGRMWIAPAAVALFIGMALWFNPHPSFQPLNLLLLVGATMLGVGFGLWRATATRLDRDADGGVWMSTSPAALFVILALFAGRTWLRGAAGADGDPRHMTDMALVAFDAFLLFALATVLTSRYVLWQRVRMLRQDV